MLDIQKKMSNSFYALLSLPATAMGFALSVQISALSWILSTKYGLDIHEIGIVWAAGPIAGIIAQPIVGLVSDKMWFLGGRRRPWILLGGILTGLMLLALPNLGIIQKMIMGGEGAEGLLAIAVAVALTLDLSINVSFNPTRSLVSDCSPMAERSKAYTWMQTVSGTFGVLAYAIAAIFGNEVLIYLGVVIALLFTIIPSCLIEEPRELEVPEDAKAEQSKTSLKDINNALLPLYGFLVYGIYVIVEKLFGLEDTVKINVLGWFNDVYVYIVNLFGVNNVNRIELLDNFILRRVELCCVILEIISILFVLFNIFKVKSNTHEFQKILLAHSFTWWGVQTMNIYMVFYVSYNILGLLVGEPLDEQITPWAFLTRDLIGAILPVLVLNVVANKIGATRTHTWSILLMALGYAIIAMFGSNIVIFFLALAIVGIGWASLVSLPFAIMSEKVDQTKMGLYMGIFNLSVVLPQLVASFKMGEVVNNAADKSIIFVICAVCLAISGVLWFAVKNEK